MASFRKRDSGQWQAQVRKKGTDKFTNSATGTWECHASFNLKTGAEWALGSAYWALQSPSSSAIPRLRVNLSAPLLAYERKLIPVATLENDAIIDHVETPTAA